MLRINANILVYGSYLLCPIPKPLPALPHYYLRLTSFRPQLDYARVIRGAPRIVQGGGRTKKNRIYWPVGREKSALCKASYHAAGFLGPPT